MVVAGSQLFETLVLEGILLRNSFREDDHSESLESEMESGSFFQLTLSSTMCLSSNVLLRLFKTHLWFVTKLDFIAWKRILPRLISAGGRDEWQKRLECFLEFFILAKNNSRLK